MFVVTLDQVGSRTDVDRTRELRDRLDRDFGSHLSLPADQNSGDEVQALLADAAATLRLVLSAARDGHWSIGLGIGAVRSPLPDATRKASGPAFIAARHAVTVAKRADARFALRTESDPAGASLTASEVEPLVTMLLLIRARRSKPGWEAVDLLETGSSQQEIAHTLGISPAAVSQRITASLWRTEAAAIPTVAKLLGALEQNVSGTENHA